MYLYEQIADDIQSAIIDGGLFQASCAESDEHNCIVVWSRHYKEQIAAVIKNGLDNAPETHRETA